MAYKPFKMKGSPMKRNFPEAFEDKNTPIKDVYAKADALYEAADKAHEKAMKIGDEPHMQKRKKHLIDKSKRLLDENYEEEMRIFEEGKSN